MIFAPHFVMRTTSIVAVAVLGGCVQPQPSQRETPPPAATHAQPQAPTQSSSSEAPPRASTPAAPVTTPPSATPGTSTRSPPATPPKPGPQATAPGAVKPSPAPPAAQPPGAEPTPAAATPTLDLAGLTERLRNTNAIGVFTKLSLKNQVDDLLEQFRDFYKTRGKPPLPELRQRYELLLLKVVSLLQDNDQSLATAVASSREAIWNILSNPQEFSKI
jgi:hypothetical protein